MKDIHRLRVEDPIQADRRLRRTANRAGQMDQIEDMGINRKGITEEEIEEKPRKGNSYGRGGGWNDKGLTSRQEQWCQLISSKPISEADAYRQIYDASNMRPSTIYQRCFKMKQNPKVRERLDDLRRKLEMKVQRDESRIRDTVLGVLFDCVEDSRATWKDKLRAAELLGKVDSIGMWIARSEQTITDHRSSTELSKELQAKLSRLIGNDVVDLVPLHDEPRVITEDKGTLSPLIFNDTRVYALDETEETSTPGAPDPP